MTVILQTWPVPEEGEGKVITKTELSADNYHHMLEQVDGVTVSGGLNWQLVASFFGMGKPIRLYYNYRIGDKEISIGEQNHSGRARHTLDAEDGGLYSIYELLGWGQQLQSIGDWLSW
jgi:hypothetical protein